MPFSTSDKVCLASAALVFYMGTKLNKQSQKNYETAKNIAANVRGSHRQMIQIQQDVQGANRALFVGNGMMRQLLTKEVSKR